MIGVWIRISQTSFRASDMSFETALILLGSWADAGQDRSADVLMGVPAVLHGEWAAIAVPGALRIPCRATAHHGRRQG